MIEKKRLALATEGCLPTELDFARGLSGLAKLRHGGLVSSSLTAEFAPGTNCN
jgi:hypothetical protein